MTWFDKFSKHMNTIFTKDDFDSYKNMLNTELYAKYLKPGSKILDIGCGLGCTAIPLSLTYKVTGIDNDKKVVEAAGENGKNFGKDITIIEGNILDLTEHFKPDSFDACTSGGVLEHFNKEQIIKMVEDQLMLAPIMIASMPINTEHNKSIYDFTQETAINHIKDGILRNFWTEDEWLDILKDFNVIHSKIKRCHTKIGQFDEMIIVIKRSVR